MRSVFAAGLALGVGLAAWSAAAQLPAPAAERPDVMMSRVTTEVIAILRHDAAAGQPTDAGRLIETKILPLFDFEHMTRIAMARNWRLASAEQQAALVAQFRTLLARSYSSALSGYRDEDIEYKPLRFASDETDVLVRSALLRRGAENLTIDYDMEKTAAGWKVYDVKIAGVSLVMTYREPFAAAVRADGIDGLVKLLSDKNRQNDLRPKGPRPQTWLAPVLMLRLVHGRP
ncbi:MAG TPA: ABC transporter substrate-binding protein [Candidatus Limnocylindrales bacterium]|nr:ABC transporter substrate-binding protein [Candidatus Limnocylindrales bacterium]